MNNKILFSTGTLESFKISFSKVLKRCFDFESQNAVKRFEDYYNHLTTGLYIAFEYPYVDKLYRDSYYHFYSSKHKEYQRDCMRISFFKNKIEKKDFNKPEGNQKLQELYMGFLILRPVSNHIIGRSVISPQIINKNKFRVCLVNYEINVQGVPLCCTGFPHTSQTSETISCAETSIWSILEYYGYKYKEYAPVLPHEIINTLNRTSYRRLIPSEGLSISQICQCIKEFGFAAVLYAKDQYKEIFEKLMYAYIESGIPVIVGLQNNNMGHAVVCIGHEDKKYKIQTKRNPDYTIEGIKFFDSANLNKKYVFIDDNHPAYQIADVNKPAGFYPDAKYHSLKIKYFVAPLYKRMYLEAYKAKELFLTILKNKKIGVKQAGFKAGKYILRFFLTSQRSFKYQIKQNKSINIQMKDYILRLKLPKFLWIAEISNEIDYNDKLAEALAILDATGDNSLDTLCFLSYPQKRVEKSLEGDYNLMEHSWEKFEIYQSNLKGEHCLWNLK